MAVQPIKVEGLREFRSSVKKLDSDLPKVIRLALNEAVDVVVNDARPKIPRRTGRAGRSLRASSTQSKAQIKAGGSRAPYFGWLDFGGRVGRRRSVVRPFRSQGRYVWLSFADRRSEVTSALEKALANVAEQAGLEVTRGQ